jgi:hypothetical protein
MSLFNKNSAEYIFNEFDTDANDLEKLCKEMLPVYSYKLKKQRIEQIKIRLQIFTKLKLFKGPQAILSIL